MAQTSLEAIRQAVRFRDQDARHVRSLADAATDIIPEVVRFFYDELLKLDQARAVFTGGEAQMKRQEALITDWLRDLFLVNYDESYFVRHRRVGETHARIGLPQYLMCTSMQLIWESFVHHLRARRIPDCETKLDSLHRLLMLELAIMLESYKVNYSEQVRRVERSVIEEKLSRAEHLAEIGQLAASLAHEIKNPLAGISGAIQIIRDQMGPADPHQSIISEILDQIHRLDATVKDLLQYARPTPPKAKKVAVDPIVQRILTVLHEEPAMQRARIDYPGASREAVIYADEAQIEQLLINLIINAAHAVDDGGLVQIRITPRDGAVELLIEDEGQGMSPSTRDRAFEPFFTTKARGTGLGLSICKRIVEVHGGSIVLNSVPRKGTRVTVLLPANRAVRSATRAPAAASKSS